MEELKFEETVNVNGGARVLVYLLDRAGRFFTAKQLLDGLGSMGTHLPDNMSLPTNRL